MHVNELIIIESDIETEYRMIIDMDNSFMTIIILSYLEKLLIEANNSLQVCKSKVSVHKELHI